MHSHRRRLLFAAGVAIALVVVGVVWAVLRDGTDEAAEDGDRRGMTVNPASEVEVIQDLPNVETSLYAHGSVWGVTSNRSDRFSNEPLEAQVVRIDPSTRQVTAVLDSPGVEPTFSTLHDQLWVRLHDRIVAVDASGNEVASIPFAFGESGDQIAARGHLWLVDFTSATVTIIDPDTSEVRRTISTGSAPVSPVVAFGHVWVPSVTDGTVTIIDVETLGATTTMSVAVGTERLEDAVGVTGGLTGDEVWVTTVDGDVLAISAGGAQFGAVRRVPIDAAVNRVHAAGNHAYLLPISGRAVLVLDLQTEELVDRIPTASIPFRAMTADGLVWVTGDGFEETLTVIDADTMAVVAEFSIGSNASNTTGPHRPIVVGDEVWVPNRGDDAIFIVTASADA